MKYIRLFNPVPNVLYKVIRPVRLATTCPCNPFVLPGTSSLYFTILIKDMAMPCFLGFCNLGDILFS